MPSTKAPAPTTSSTPPAAPAGSPTPPRLLLDITDAAKALDKSPRWLWGKTAPRGPIPYVPLGRNVKYDPRDLVAYIDAQKVRPAP